MAIRQQAAHGRVNVREKSAGDCKQKPGVIAPVVDLKRCEGKGDCVTVCPENVFEIRRIDNADYVGLDLMHRLKLRVHGMKVAYTPNTHACRSCGLCVTACPERAITLARTA
ncbi:4Fe-4S ferredoxin [Burkholderia lata]|nr:4Fe-4S ferredoxin [Burkholderia lata]